jgi:hypothetical protein
MSALVAKDVGHDLSHPEPVKEEYSSADIKRFSSICENSISQIQPSP